MSQESQSARDLFLLALDLPPAERKALLDQSCASDSALRRQVELLLKAHDEPNSLLDQQRIDIGLAADSPAYVKTVQEPKPDDASGTVIGRYKVLEQIGEGGFGIVYMAEQQTPIRRRVALKIIKPGMDSRQVLARFHVEQQALAMMDHPNIARVLDAGETESGHPYFVMELVRGVPITEYCDEKNLTIPDRLNLFVDVCHAVQHAHQKGIIHRDLKPSNVLVTLHDGVPVPKVIDFGVAKAINQQLTQETLFTRFAEMIGTPLYMSPEQAEMSGFDIDTRSDIYSLGVLLYELLTGTTPLEKSRLTKAAFDEIRRIIREEDPPKPSTRLSALGEVSASVAARRHVEPRQLDQMVRGDLDWIVMKTLEKDRNRRYETANGLAVDIRRYLANEPVSAGPPSASYRFTKFAQRNWAVLSIACLVFAALLLGIAGTVWQAFVATHQRDRAIEAERLAKTRHEEAEEARRQAVQERDRALNAEQQAAANFRKAREAVDDYFTLVSESTLLDVPGLQPLRKQLLEAALRYYETFLKQKGANSDVVHTELAATWLRISQVYHHNNRPDEGIQALSRGLDVIAEIERKKPLPADFPARLAGFRKEGRILQYFDLWPTDAAAGIRVYQRAAETWERFAAENPSVPGFRSDLGSFYSYIGGLHRRQNELRAELESQRKSRRILEGLVRDYPNVAEYRASLAESIERVGMALPPQESERTLREALAMRQALASEFPDNAGYRAGLANCWRRLGSKYHTFGRPQDSEAAYRQSLALWEKLAAAYPGSFGYRKQQANVHDGLHLLFRQTGRGDDAIAEIRRAVEIRTQLATESPGERDDNLLELEEAYFVLASLLLGAGNTAEADATYQKGINVRQEFGAGKIHPKANTEMLGHGSRNYALWLASVGRHQEAETVLRKALHVFEELSARTPDRLLYRHFHADTFRLLGNLFRSTGRAGEAEQALRRAVELHEKRLAELPGLAFNEFEYSASYIDLLSLFVEQKRIDSATELAQRARRLNSDNTIVLFQLANALNGTELSDEASATHAASVSAARRFVDADFQHESYRIGFADNIRPLAEASARRGQNDDAIALFRMELTNWERLVAEFPANEAYRYRLARCHNDFGTLLKTAGKIPESEEEYRTAIRQYGDLVAEFPKNGSYKFHQAHSHLGLAYVKQETKDPEAAENEFRLAAAAFEKAAADDPTLRVARRDLGWTSWRLGDLAVQFNRHDEALAQFQRALTVFSELAKETPNDRSIQSELANVHWKLGAFLRGLTRNADAEPQFREALDLRRKLAAEAPNDARSREKLQQSYRELIETLKALNKNEEAESLNTEMLKAFPK